jgi:hypothetical protein
MLMKMNMKVWLQRPSTEDLEIALGFECSDAGLKKLSSFSGEVTCLPS